MMETPVGKQAAAECPWCGQGTRLLIRGDGAGGQSLWCAKCACKGPTVGIGKNDFDVADAATIARWSRRAGTGRPHVAADVVERVRLSVSLQQAMCGGAIAAGVSVPVSYADLHILLAALNPPPG